MVLSHASPLNLIWHIYFLRIYEKLPGIEFLPGLKAS